ncbi:MAG: tRNA pseudouridine(13) synthase TruD, partial [Deltaproteobacteria bacterium]
MKIKVKPEDFIVEEKADLKFHKGGEHRVYLLTKRGFNTVDLLLRLSKKLGIPFSNFSYGGKKDRHALTTQYITIKDK